MQRDDALYLVNYIMDTFGKPRVKGEKEGYWHSELADMQAAAIPSIQAHFAALDSLTQNLSREIRRAYNLWLDTQPKASRKTACATCNGEGTLHVLQFATVYQAPAEYVGRCPHCENWRGVCGEAVKPVRFEHLTMARPASELFKADDYERCIDAYQLNERMNHVG